MDKIKSRIHLLSLLIIVCVFTAVISKWDFGARAWTASASQIECPDMIDLGDHEEAEQVRKMITISNRGAGELVISNIRTSCSCTGLEYEQDGELIRATELRIPAASAKDLSVRVTVHGVPGAPIKTRIEFDTNDPNRPTFGIDVVPSRVRSGVIAIPSGVMAPAIAVGELFVCSLDVVDDSTAPRAIKRITSSDPDCISVTILPINKASSAHVTDGTVIGRLEVRVCKKTAGPFDDEIRVELENDREHTKRIAVRGNVVNPVEVSPSLLVLPRNSQEGPVYSATCVCRSSDKKPLHLSVVSTPPGLTVEFLSTKTDAYQQLLRVTMHPTVSQTTRPKDEKRIRMLAAGIESGYYFDIRVICGNGGPE